MGWYWCTNLDHFPIIGVDNVDFMPPYNNLTKNYPIIDVLVVSPGHNVSDSNEPID